MSHVFVSYDRADAEFVSELVSRIQSAGIRVWSDSHSLHAGEDWRAKIDEAVREAFALIVVMTPDSRTSEYVSYEWACALGAQVDVIPILLTPTELAQRLAAMHYLDFTDRQGQPWDRLIQELRRSAESRSPGSTPDRNTVPAVVQKAAEALDSLDDGEQARGIQALSQIDHPSAREALANAVHHPSRSVRIRAALELSRFKDARAVAGLIESQRYWQLRWEFVRRIAPLGNAATPALLEALRDHDGELREYAAHALGEIKDPSAMPFLVNATNDPLAGVRDASAKALAKIQGPPTDSTDQA